MSRENIDKEINSLYQQRKEKIVTPTITSKELLETNSLKKHTQNKTKVAFKITKFSSIIGFTFVASFSIFALINQLKTVDKTNPNNTVTVIHRDISLNKNIKPKEVVKPAIVLPNVPPKTNMPTTAIQPAISPPSIIEIKPVIPQVAINFDSIIPKIAPTTLELALIKKVLPQYPLKAKQQQLSAVVKLSYWVNQYGEVTDIKIIKSTHRQFFDKAAIKALKQWQYDVNSMKITTNSPVKHEIEFNFTLNKL